MNETQLMQQHSLFQKSWTGQSCSHGKASHTEAKINHETRRKNPGTVESRINSGIKISSLKIGNKVEKNKVSHVLPPLGRCQISPLPVVSSRSLHRNQGDHSTKNTSQCRPWRERVSKTNKHIDIHYSKIAPKEKWMEYKPRQYVSNPKYGSIYEIRRQIKRVPIPPPPNSWLWENEFRLWRLDQNKNPPRSYPKRKLFGKIGKQEDDKPHAELFAAYHQSLLVKQKRQISAIEIQRHVRGWLIRKKIKQLKRQILVGLSMSWPKFKADYRETIVRIKSRYDVMDNSCKFDLKQVQDFVDQKEKCERIFDKIAVNGKLEKQALPEFFQRCNLHPTEGEINKAFNIIFRGSQDTAEVVFVLDCSASFGPVNFQHQVNFVKDVVLGFDVAPDRVRVGVVPYNESVFSCFGLTKFTSRDEVLEAVGKLEFTNGLTRTDLAINMMRQLFKSARPGVQKIAIVITDGKSPEPDRTKQEARLARDENIEIFTIGVGYAVDTVQLEVIAGNKDHVKTCSDYSTLSQLKALVKNRICLGSDQVIGNQNGVETDLSDVCRPLTRDEVMDILWTVYPPEATGLEIRKSRWIRPVVDGQEAWSLLDDRVLQQTNYKQCLRLVLQAKLERDGVMDIPTDLKWGVEQVSNLEEALEKVETFLKMKEKHRLETELSDKLGQHNADALDEKNDTQTSTSLLSINNPHRDSSLSDLTSRNVQILKLDNEEWNATSNAMTPEYLDQRPRSVQILQITREDSNGDIKDISSSFQILTIDHEENREITLVKERGVGLADASKITIEEHISQVEMAKDNCTDTDANNVDKAHIMNDNVDQQIVRYNETSYFT